MQKYKNKKLIKEQRGAKMECKTQKKYLLIEKTLNTTNLLVNPLTYIQMTKLLSQIMQLEKNESVAIGRKVREYIGVIDF